MKRLGILVALGAILATTTGCESTCDVLCEGYYYCGEEDLDEVGCKWDDDIDTVIDNCLDECDKAYDKLTGDEADEFDLCVECVEEEIGVLEECKDGDMADAIGDCDDECEEDGAEEFWEEFDWPDDSDIDC